MDRRCGSACEPRFWMRRIKPRNLPGLTAAAGVSRICQVGRYGTADSNRSAGGIRSTSASHRGSARRCSALARLIVQHDTAGTPTRDRREYRGGEPSNAASEMRAMPERAAPADGIDDGEKVGNSGRV